MNDIPDMPVRKRIPSIAVLLSLVSPGLGQIYCGRFNRGIVFYGLGAILSSVGLLALAGIGWFTWSLAGGLLIVAAGVWAYAVVDAYRLAQNAPADYALKEYNRWYAYATLAFLAIPLGLTWALFLRTGVVEAFYIASESMAPTFQRGDRVLANKTVYRNEPVRYGDVVILLNPNQRHQKQIKRIVALAGDTVEIKDGELLLNGVPLPRTEDHDAATGPSIFWEHNGSARYRILQTAPHIDQPWADDQANIRALRELQVPSGQCFVLGDNRQQSLDSRSYGFVPLADVIGRVDYVYWPHWRRVDAVSP